MDATDLRNILKYDPVTGIFTWLVSRGRVKAGDVAGVVDTHGYRKIRVYGKSYRASRLAELYVMGKWPEDIIDHKNRQKDDDRWDNLRPATYSQNGMNTGIRVDSSSGIKGVDWHKHKKKWRACIGFDNRHIHLGLFDDLQDAIKARQLAEIKYFGEFAYA